jgi:DNA-directed RNA polymerase I subunit RPA2
MAIIRPSFQKRGPTYTNFGVMIRCVRPDQTSHTLTIHYLTDGNCTLRFTYRKQEYMLPLVMVLKALIDTTDKEIYDSIVQSDTENTFVTDRVELMLRGFKRFALFTREQCLAFMGKPLKDIVLLCRIEISRRPQHFRQFDGRGMRRVPVAQSHFGPLDQQSRQV